MRLERLFSPVKIGNLKLKNRIVMAPMETRFGALNGEVSQRAINYYVERAKGGTGLIITGITSIRPDGKWGHEEPSLHDDSLVPSFHRLTEAVHAAGAKIACQLAFNPGGISAWVLAPIPSKALTPPPAGLLHLEASKKWVTLYSKDEIEGIIEAYAEAARRARDAGFDAVEFHGASGYLLKMFMSPASNKRTDEYGGDLWGLSNMPRQVLKRAKAKAGSDFPMIFRLHAEERLPGGRTLDQTLTMVRWLVEAGADALHVGLWGAGELPPYLTWVPPMGIKGGFTSYLAGAVRGVVNVPVIAVGRITDPRLAERILQRGEADLVAFGRGLVADPHLADKASKGAFEDIRRCIGCNQGCLGVLRTPHGMGCLYNPEVGKEGEMKLTPTTSPQRVVIVGGGPAGMETARSAALRGHAVTLYERSDRLGGQLRLAARCPSRGEFAQVYNWLERQVRKAEVKVVLGVNATASLIKEERPDIVVLATGSMPVLPEVPGADSGRVVLAHDVLKGKAEVGHSVLVLGGGVTGFGTADYLASRSRKVTVLEELESAAKRIDPVWEYGILLYEHFKRQGVHVLTCSRIKEIVQGGVRISNERRQELLEENGFLVSIRAFGLRFYEEQEAELIQQFDTIVSALASVSDDSLLRELWGSGPELYLVGEAGRAEDTWAAIRQAAEVGYRI